MDASDNGHDPWAELGPIYRWRRSSKTHGAAVGHCMRLPRHVSRGRKIVGVIDGTGRLLDANEYSRKPFESTWGYPTNVLYFSRRILTSGLTVLLETVS